jgi:hypothetical protein
LPRCRSPGPALTGWPVADAHAPGLRGERHIPEDSLLALRVSAAEMGEELRMAAAVSPSSWGGCPRARLPSWPARVNAMTDEEVLAADFSLVGGK